MYTRILSTSQSLAGLLLRRFVADVADLGSFFGGGAAAGNVYLSTPQELTGKSGLSLWLYRVSRDDTRLNDPPRLRPLASGQIEVVPPPLPLRLHYLMTPLAKDQPELEQRILGAVLQAFYSTPILSGSDLAGDFAGTRAQIYVRLEALSLDETARVWEALSSSFQLCVSYEVTLANIDSAVLPQREALVESVHPRVAQLVGEAS
jgi:Pvc16 N-terminal domain